jgi:hypothetical protein
MNRLAVAVAGAVLLGVGAPAAQAQDTSMSFFITGAGPGDGANLGGLKGADAHCEALAASVGAGGRAWRAYLSSSAEHARDRIGNGPWYNAKGVLIARDLAALHGDANAINKQTGLTIQTAPLPPARPAMTGPIAATAARSSAITTGLACATMRLRNRGTRRMARVAVASRTCAAPAATACSIASPWTEARRVAAAAA